MYNIPELYGTQSYLRHVSQNDIQVQERFCTYRTSVPCDQDLYDLCCMAMIDHNLMYPKSTEEALEIYYALRFEIRNLLFN